MEKYLVATLCCAARTRQTNADPWVSIKKIWEIAAAMAITAGGAMMQREDQQLEKTPTAKVPRVAARPASREDASRPPRGNSSRTQHGNATRAPL